MTSEVGLLEGHSRRLSEAVMEEGCGLTMFKELVQQYSCDAAKETLLDSWKVPRGIEQLHLVGVALTQWENTRKRLVQMGERLAEDEKTKCESLVVLLLGHALTRKIVASLKVHHGRALTSQQVIHRVLIDTEYWEHELRKQKSEPKEAHAAVLEEKAVAQVEAFAAGGDARDSAAGGKDARDQGKGKQGYQRGGKGKGGGDSVRGKPGYGHCSAHQFLEEGCKDRATCPYWHMPNQEGRFKVQTHKVSR